jgi:uncharacterized protein Yka (UPF0111/DUF47 family)
MDETKSITVNERILPPEDFSHKKDMLRKYAEEISECDADFFALVENVFIDEKGEIVEEMITKTKQMQVWNNNLLMETNLRISQVVNRFETQVDDMKTQKVTYAYKQLFPTS